MIDRELESKTDFFQKYPNKPILDLGQNPAQTNYRYRLLAKIYSALVKDSKVRSENIFTQPTLEGSIAGKFLHGKPTKLESKLKANASNDLFYMEQTYKRKKDQKQFKALISTPIPPPSIPQPYDYDEF